MSATPRVEHDRERVIPRPSQRRASPRRGGAVVRTPDGLLIVGDTATSPSNRPGRADPATSTGLTEDSGWASWMQATLKVIGAVSGLGAGLAFGILGFLGREDTLFGVVLAPALTLIAAIVAKRVVLPRSNEFVFAAVVAGFGARMLGAVPRLISGADSPVYQREGERIADALRSFDLAVDTGRSIPGTGAVRYFSGVVNVLTGSNAIATFLVFVVLAFVGQVFFLFAVKPVLNDKQMRLAALFIMLSPTMVYWPSSVGKESLALFGIGIGLFGVSRVYERQWNGVVPLLFGGFVVGMVRPHVAMLLLAGLVVGLFARRAVDQRRLAVHIVVLAVVLVGAMLTTGASARLFDLESFDGVSDVSAALDFAEDRTSQDDSAFTAARVSSVTDYPWATLTVLFRPFIWEAENAASFVSAIEGMMLAAAILYAAPGLVSNLRALVQKGQLLFAVGFTSVFIFVFAAIGNFGILSRQRAQVVPFVLLLVAFGVGAERLRGARTSRASNIELSRRGR